MLRNLTTFFPSPARNLSFSFHLSSKFRKERFFSTFVDQINPQKTALLLIEYQNEFTTPGGKLHDAVAPVMKHTNMLQNTTSVIEKARKKGIKIFHIGISFSKDFKEISKTPFGILGNVKNGQCFIQDTWNSAFVDSVKPIDGDIIVLGKSGLCGFESTNLQFLLGQHSIETVVIGGFLTNCCVESTMRAAYEKGFNVITLTDCTAATSLAEQEAAVKFTFPMFSIPLNHQEFLAKI